MPADPGRTACLTEADCPWKPREVPAGLDLSETHKYGFSGVRQVPHDCSRPELHWESRVTGWSSFHGMVEIATRFRPDGNPCSAEWVYGDDCLTALDDGTRDWTETSRYAVGARVKFRWDCPEHLHYRDRTLLHGVVESAHICPGDWLCSFVVPGSGACGPWRFVIAVNESAFV